MIAQGLMIYSLKLFTKLSKIKICRGCFNDKFNTVDMNFSREDINSPLKFILFLYNIQCLDIPAGLKQIKRYILELCAGNGESRTQDVQANYKVKYYC